MKTSYIHTVTMTLANASADVTLNGQRRTFTTDTLALLRTTLYQMGFSKRAIATAVNSCTDASQKTEHYERSSA